MHQGIDGAEQLGHVAAEANEPNAIAAAVLARLARPHGLFRSAADDDEIDVPLRIGAQPHPRVEHGVERLAAIAERSDERDEPPLDGPPEAGTRSRALVRRHVREAHRIAAVIYDGGA